LSYRYWRTHYAGSADAVGHTIQLDDRPYTIIGIMPDRFKFLNADVYVPMAQDGGPRTALLRVRPGVSKGAAAAELQALGQQTLDPPQDGTERRDVRIRLTTLRDDEAGSLRGVLGILLGAVLLLLVIGCANVSILLVGRGITRRSELAVRRAIGASEGRILRQLLTESMVVSFAGVITGVGLAYGLLSVILRWMPPRVIPREMDLGIDVRVLIFAAVLAVLVGIAAGISPGFALSRSRFSLVGRFGNRSTGGAGGSTRSHLVLTIVQTAATVVLLAGAGAAVRTFLTLVAAPLGYAAENVATFGITLKDRTLMTSRERATYYDHLQRAIAAVPGVTSVAVTGPAPLPPVQPRRSRIEIPGVSDGSDQVAFAMVSAAYFSTLRVPLRVGRTWVEAEDLRYAHVGVINDVMARRYWPKANPIGQRMRLDALRPPDSFVGDSPGNDQWIQVIGVVGDVRNDGLRKPVLPQVYVPYTLWTADAVLLLVHNTGNQGAIVDAVKRQVATVNRDQPVMSSSTLEERLWQNGWAREQFIAVLFSLCAALALALAAIGMYSVVACAVSSRMREFGLRIALGASSTRIVGGIFKSALTPVALGLCCGLALVALLHRPITAWTESSLWNPASLGPSVLALAAVGCCAVLIPAWRAATLAPMCVLRADE
jgi:predicted permease